MRILFFIFFVVTCLNVVIDAENTTYYADAENTTLADSQTTLADVTEGSGVGADVTSTSTASTTKTTTLDPCEKCNMNEVCPHGCNCTGSNAKSLSGICAEPCDYNYAWCLSGAECSPAETDDGYQCECAYSFYKDKDDNCNEGKYFGGQITFSEVPDGTDNATIEEILNGIYNGTSTFVKSVVLGKTDVMSSGTYSRALLSTATALYDYQLIYEKNSDVTSEEIESKFFTSTKCEEDSGILPVGSLLLDCDASSSTIIVLGVLCNKSYSAPECINSTAECAEGGGVMFCQCKEGLTNYRKPTQDALECIKIPCLSNSDCNEPFGWCEKIGENELQYYCECMWGFEGGDCNEPWGFVFTVLSGCFALILIIVLIICICNSTKSKPSKTEAQEDLNLKNPFIDFQPGLVRAKVPNNMYSVSDSFDMRESSNGKNNGAYDHAYDATGPKQTSSFQNDYQTVDAGKDYF